MTLPKLPYPPRATLAPIIIALGLVGVAAAVADGHRMLEEPKARKTMQQLRAIAGSPPNQGLGGLPVEFETPLGYRGVVAGEEGGTRVELEAVAPEDCATLEQADLGPRMASLSILDDDHRADPWAGRTVQGKYGACDGSSGSAYTMTWRLR